MINLEKFQNKLNCTCKEDVLFEIIEDIECDWAKDFIFSKSGDLRKYNIFLSYPANEEYVDCFCKGFVTEAEKYILEKNN